MNQIAIINNAGWSSLEARLAHNQEVGGSNPPPAISGLTQIVCREANKGSSTICRH